MNILKQRIYPLVTLHLPGKGVEAIRNTTSRFHLRILLARGIDCVDGKAAFEGIVLANEDYVAIENFVVAHPLESSPESILA